MKERWLGTLTIVGTPIGNLEDAGARALRVLRETSALACEDTRVTRKLLARYDIPVPQVMFSYHEHNEERAGRQALALLDGGTDVALCSDGGMPGISDPGYRLITAALDAGHDVVVVPGPCAVETALVASGLSTASYTFLGFPPRKPGKLRNFLAAEAERPHTLILYESPHRIGRLLEAALDSLGDRRVAVCLELTKTFERVHRGWLTELIPQFADTVKGEAVVVIAGNHPKFVREGGGEA